MIISRAPVRICLAGGGTDLEAYYSEFGGLTISAAIDKYVYTTTRKAAEWQIVSADYQEVLCRLKDGVPDSEHLRLVHAVIREALSEHEYENMPQNVFTAAEVPPGTGLGSSGAAAVSVAKAFRSYAGGTAGDIAEMAYHVEAETLGAPVGKQDQYISAYGGLRRMLYRTGEAVKVTSVPITLDTLQQLERRLLLFYTGRTRASKDILTDQKQRTLDRDPSMIDALHKVRALADDMYTAIETGDVDRVGRLLHRGWALKRRFGPVSTEDIDTAYHVALSNGALGGKLPGAGGGGYMLLYCEEGAQETVREAMAQFGFRELLFNFDFEGAKIITMQEDK